MLSAFWGFPQEFASLYSCRAILHVIVHYVCLSDVQVASSGMCLPQAFAFITLGGEASFAICQTQPLSPWHDPG